MKKTTTKKGKKECKRCKHEWTSFKADPVVCPRCKSYKWKEERKYEEVQLL